MDETRVSQGNTVGWNTGTTTEVVARHDWDGRDTLAVTIVTAVAQLKNVDAIDLSPLSDVINPEALDRVFAHPVRAPVVGEPTDAGTTQPARATVRFRYAACDVTVWADGTVIVKSA
ncbi:HalOD1 output domain-containing protein [Haloferax sp. DFSO52]|uniref:HalOD1 output domain-containing protein n=1 Tax=Haloferax sp. DFSO52 TaxID=3388505 RepID=UPI003A8B5FA0